MKLQTSNFAARSRVRNTKQKNEKLGQKGAWPRSRDLLFEFRDPPLSPVRMKLQTSNFAAGSRVWNAKQEMKNWAKRGRGLGHVTSLLNSGTPLLSSVSDGATDVKFCSRVDGMEY